MGCSLFVLHLLIWDILIFKVNSIQPLCKIDIGQQNVVHG